MPIFALAPKSATIRMTRLFGSHGTYYDLPSTVIASPLFLCLAGDVCVMTPDIGRRPSRFVVTPFVRSAGRMTLYGILANNMNMKHTNKIQ